MSSRPVHSISVTMEYADPIYEIASLLAYHSPKHEFKRLYRQLAACMFGCADTRFGMWSIDTNSEDGHIKDLISNAKRSNGFKSFVTDELLDGLIKVQKALDEQTMTACRWLRTLTLVKVSPATAIFRVTAKPSELMGGKYDDAPVELSWALTVAAEGVWLHSVDHVLEHGENLGRMIDDYASDYAKKHPWIDSTCMNGATLRLPESALAHNQPMFVFKCICSIQELRSAVGLLPAVTAFGEPGYGASDPETMDVRRA